MILKRITESYYSYEDGRLSQILTYDCATDALVEALEYRYDEQGRLIQRTYYFDNGSDIETIHSEKPFNVSLQFGFRFGF